MWVLLTACKGKGRRLQSQGQVLGESGACVLESLFMLKRERGFIRQRQGIPGSEGKLYGTHQNGLEAHSAPTTVEKEET